MNFVAFAIKRAHLKGLAMGQRIARVVGLTPARFDLLWLIHRAAPGAMQSELRRELDVARPTVSRMVRSLEELGFVRRVRAPSDRRTWFLSFTEWGERAFDRALRLIHGIAPLDWVYKVAILYPGERSPNGHTFTRLFEFFLDVCLVARTLGDRADEPYPSGHPAD